MCEFLSKDEINMVDFIKRCLDIDPSKRMTCEEAMRHDWFKTILIQKERQIQA